MPTGPAPLTDLTQRAINVRFFDWLAGGYDLPPFSWFMRRMQRAAVQELTVRLPAQRARHLLDVGVGTGWGLSELARRFPGARLHGLDLSPAMLDHARRRPGLGPCGLLRADVAALPLASASLDGATCTEAFHHFPRPAASLAELRRALRPGGVLVLVDFSPPALPLAELLFRLEPGFVGLYPAARWRAMLVEAGFALLAQRRVGGGALLTSARAVAEGDDRSDAR